MGNKKIFYLLILIILQLPIRAEKITFRKFQKYDLNKVSSKKLYNFFKLMQWQLKKATLLLQYREVLGGFESMDQLKYLKGIGAKFSGIFSMWFKIKTINTSLKYPKKRLDLNSCSFHQLMKLPQMNRFIAHKIISLRKKKKGFNSRWEILRIRSISPAYYRIIKSHIYTDQKKTNKIEFTLDSYFNSSKTITQKTVLKNRMRLQLFKKFKMNFNLQKVFPLDNNKNKLLSANLNYKNQSNDKLIVGDFDLIVGEGLVFGPLFNMEANNFESFPAPKITLKSHSSFSPEKMLRGFSADFHLQKNRVTFFISQQKLSAKSSTNYTWYKQFVSIIAPHKLRSTRTTDNDYQQETIGSILWSTTSKKNSLGFGWTSFYYKTPILIFDDKENIFSGQSLGIANIFYNLQLDNFKILGESACSIYSKLTKAKDSYYKQLIVAPAFSGGFKIKLGKIKFTTLYDLIGNSYISPLAKTQQDPTLSAKLTFKPRKNMTISGLINHKNSEKKKIIYAFRWLYKTDSYRLKVQIGLNEKEDFLSKNIKINFRYSPISILSLRTTFNLEQKLNSGNINNYLSFGLVYDNQKRLKIICQWINFGESTSENILYSYKYHLAGWHNMAEQLIGVGQNIFLMAEYEFADSLKVGLLYNQKVFQKIEQPQSELQQDFSLALKLKF